MSSRISESTVKYFAKLDGWVKTTPKAGQIIRVFLDTHMGYGHPGLARTAKKEGILVDDLERGEFVVFVNSAQTAMKVYTGGNCIAHVKMPGSAKIDLGIINLLPTFFSGGVLNYKGALEDLVKKKVRARKTRKPKEEVVA